MVDSLSNGGDNRERFYKGRGALENMVNCLRCEKREAKTDLKHLGALCQPCFLQTVEKRARKHLRTTSPIKRGEKICVIVDESKESKLAEYFLEHVFETIPCETEKRPLNDVGDLSPFDKVFYPLDADDQAGEFLLKVFKGTEGPKRLSILSNTLDSEIKLYMDLKAWTYKEHKTTEKAQIIKELEAMYPGSTFGLMKSKQQLE